MSKDSAHTDHTFSQPQLTFTTLVATPKTTCWAQAYHAGKLFAVISLQRIEETEEERSLGAIGKEILNSLEKEFFALEGKNLAGVKTAIAISLEKIPSTIAVSLAVGSLTNTILYLFVQGGGKALLKRGDKTATLLGADTTSTLLTASGYAKDHDILFLETQEFAKRVSIDELDNAPTPTLLVEAITPTLHADETGTEAFLAVVCNNVGTVPVDDEMSDNDVETETSPKEETDRPPILASFRSRLPTLSTQTLFAKKKQMLFFAIIILLIGMFGIGVVVTRQKQENDKIQVLFSQVYPSAQKQYEEGMALMDLNTNIARDDFEKAKTALEKTKTQLPKDSQQGQQVADLLDKVNAALSTIDGTQSIQTAAADLSASPILASLIKNGAALFATIDDKGQAYTLTTDGIQSVDADGKTGKTLVKNESDWTAPAGFGTFGGNFYVLDKKENSIIKFVPSTDGYTASDYLTADTQADFAKTNSLAIDSSIYVLGSDGTVMKYTRGNKDEFALDKLPSPLVKPTKIFTNADTDNIYILDPGQGSIIVVDKNGAYQTQYKTGVLKNAKDFDVSEKDKKIFVLTGGKIYQIEMK